MSLDLLAIELGKQLFHLHVFDSDGVIIRSVAKEPWNKLP
jgi:hypothetical protein